MQLELSSCRITVMASKVNRCIYSFWAFYLNIASEAVESAGDGPRTAEFGLHNRLRLAQEIEIIGYTAIGSLMPMVVMMAILALSQWL